MIPGVGPYSLLFTPKAGSLFHAVFHMAHRIAIDSPCQATKCAIAWLHANTQIRQYRFRLSTLPVRIMKTSV